MKHLIGAQIQISFIWPKPVFFCCKTVNSNLRREWRESTKAIVARRDELVEEEEEGEQEIRRRAAEQAEKWLVKLRGDLEEKKRGRSGKQEEAGREG